MKKKLLYGLTMVMTVVMLGGCGSKKAEKVELTLGQVLEGVAENVVTIESIEFDAGGKLDAKIEQNGEKVEVNGSASMDAVIKSKDPSLHMQGKLDYKCKYNNTTLSGNHTAEIYGEGNEEEDIFYMYAKLDDEEWKCTEEELSDFTNELGEIDVEEIKEGLKELEKEEEFNKLLKLNDTIQKANDKECYLVYADVDKKLLDELIESGEMEFDNIEEIEDVKVKLEIYFEKNTFHPVKIVIDAQLKGNSENMSVDVKEFKFELNSKINDSKAVKVPEDVKNNAVNEEDDEEIFSEIIG